MTERRLGKDQAKAKLNRCIENGRVRFSSHSREELEIDKLTTDDALTVCRSGSIHMEPDWDIGRSEWTYRIEGLTADRRRMAVQFKFKADSAILITAFERTT